MKIEYSKDIAQPPAHLDLKFFEDVIENALRQSTFKIHKIHFSMGSKTGENYCSEIYRVQITYSGNNYEKLKNLSLIIKSMLQTEATDFLIDLDVYIKEKVMYRDILPRLEMLLPDGAKFGARLYFSLKEPIKTLVFEDLCDKGFEVASRESGLDVAHARLVLQKLAQFHATSMVLAKKVVQFAFFTAMGQFVLMCLDAGDAF
ncbi:uncharacterized protein LOC119666791 [Teleopsis dalmanni]|uniref:uncharacterized protein LOC119666791 n=1 Tax=Teleopsis dalmanni TaxID=139649 RepID=UPI0018CC8296|nr:uncharacterized protein LOC119666791 [Teleopsis dalmanni]